MNKNKVERSFQQKIDDRLRRIANFLLLNASFIDNLGLLNGKMGIAIFFYHYSRYTQNKIFEDYAGELIDEIYEEINVNTPINFSDGLTGIGWGVEYLVRNNFIEGDTDEVLAEIDNTIYKHRLNSPVLIDSGDDLFGYGFYTIARLKGHKIDDDDIKTLIKKHHLIFLTDECERLLIHKRYLDFNILTLSPGTINSLLWFLIEMYKLRLFPVKVNKLFLCLPEYLTFYNKENLTVADNYTLHSLSSGLCEIFTEERLQVLYKSVAAENEIVLGGIADNKDFVSALVTASIQRLIYNQGVPDELSPELFKRAFDIIDNEYNWNQQLDQVNKFNLGLTGFAGSGFYILNEINKKDFSRKKIIEKVSNKAS
jgi:hypothetical protein